jgi:hypothetical protein
MTIADSELTKLGGEHILPGMLVDIQMKTEERSA